VQLLSLLIDQRDSVCQVDRLRSVVVAVLHFDFILTMSFSKRRGKLEEACDNENDNNEANQAMGKASRGI